MALSTLMEEIRMRAQLPSPEARRAIRKEAGVTQEAFGKELGVTGATICRWENGDRTPSGAELRAYADLLDRVRHEIGWA